MIFELLLLEGALSPLSDFLQKKSWVFEFTVIVLRVIIFIALIIYTIMFFIKH